MENFKSGFTSLPFSMRWIEQARRWKKANIPTNHMTVLRPRPQEIRKMNITTKSDRVVTVKAKMERQLQLRRVGKRSATIFVSSGGSLSYLRIVYAQKIFPPEMLITIPQLRHLCFYLSCHLPASRGRASADPPSVSKKHGDFL